MTPDEPGVLGEPNLTKTKSDSEGDWVFQRERERVTRTCSRPQTDNLSHPGRETGVIKTSIKQPRLDIQRDA